MSAPSSSSTTVTITVTATVASTPSTMATPTPPQPPVYLAAGGANGMHHTASSVTVLTAPNAFGARPLTPATHPTGQPAAQRRVFQLPNGGLIQTSVPASNAAAHVLATPPAHSTLPVHRRFQSVPTHPSTSPYSVAGSGNIH